MRITAWMLLVGLLSGMLAGCSTPRFGLSKSEPPTTKPEERVKYGNPWKKEKSESEIASSKSGSPAMPADLAEQIAKSRAASAKPNPSLTDTLKRAAAAEARGDLDAARAAYLEVVASQPNHVEAHHRLGVIADMNRDAQTADDHYARAYAANPRDADLLSDMGYSLYLRGRFDTAEVKLKEALDQNPNHRSAQNNLGLLYGKQGKYDQALAMFRQTGTENEAQKNIAALFPNGRPDNTNLARNPGNGPAAMSPAAPGTTAPPMPADIDQRLVGGSRETPQGTNPQRSPSGGYPPAGNGQSFVGNPGSSTLPGMSGGPAAQNGSNWGAGSANPQGPLSNPAQGQGPWGTPPGTTVAPVAGPTPGPGDFWQGGLADPSAIPYPQSHRQSSGFAEPRPGTMSNALTGPMNNGQNSVQNFAPGNLPWPTSPRSGTGAQGNWGNSENGIEPATYVDRGATGGNWNGMQPSNNHPAPPASAADASRLAAQMGLAAGPGTMFSPFGSGPSGDPGSTSPWNAQGPSSSSAQFAPADQFGQAGPWNQSPIAPSQGMNGSNPWGGNGFAGGSPPRGDSGPQFKAWSNSPGQTQPTPPQNSGPPIAPPSPWNDLQPTPTWPQAWPSAERPSFETTAPPTYGAPGQSSQSSGTIPQWPYSQSQSGQSQSAQSQPYGASPSPMPAGNGTSGMPVVTPGPASANSSMPVVPGTSGAANAPNSAGATTFPNWPYAPARP